MPSDTPKEAKLQIQSKKDEEPPRSILTKGPSSPPPTLNQDSNIVHPQPKHSPNTTSSAADTIIINTFQSTSNYQVITTIINLTGKS